MAFNLCPLRLSITMLFRHEPVLLALPRQPLEQRAAAASRQRKISLAKAQRYLGRERFQLNRNIFSISGKSAANEGHLLALLISHFGSITRGKKINIEMNGLQTEGPTCEIEVLGRDKLCHAVVEFDLFRDQGRLILNFIAGSASGLAGRSLIALYNVAKELKVGLIGFYITAENDHSRRFFYHMDFGRPVTDDWTWWEQPVS